MELCVPVISLKGHNETLIQKHYGTTAPMDLVVLLAFSSWLAPALAAVADEDKDYESLRIGGLVIAAILFLLGIALIVSPEFLMWKRLFLKRLPFISNRKLQPATLWETEVLNISSAAMSTTETMFPDRSDFEYGKMYTCLLLKRMHPTPGVEVFQLKWYPDPKDRGASSDCVGNTICT
ncbi:FXYD domain-containing ion transport regulator 6 [Liparis tanakae]|uniref:FXYD domain-containing ion transport regulator n=1 Tax=Liparis tanakae TaxID=230148 RepID=A0A4Z2HB07_9TELE|nr:FXYD domain-containing ion transport regulator 6 [Liparis tanakae]